MVSLKERKKSEITDYLHQKMSKMSSMLDESDYNLAIFEAIQKLDEILYNPRNCLIESDKSMLDVTSLLIDEVTNVYYAPNQHPNMIFPELGFLPFISSGTSLNALESTTNYLQTQTVINILTRKMNVAYDWELYPIDPSGKQYLLVNCNGLCRIEYLPHLDPKESSWNLYENEYSFILNYSYCLVNIQNYEYQMSASVLGVGKDATSLIQYWKEKATTIKDDFLKSSIITYIQ